MYEDFEIENSWVDKLDAHDELTKITKRIVVDINNDGKYQSAIEKILYFAKTKSIDINVKEILDAILEQDFDKIKKVVNKIEYKEIIKDKDGFIVIDYKT